MALSMGAMSPWHGLVTEVWGLAAKLAVDRRLDVDLTFQAVQVLAVEAREFLVALHRLSVGRVA